MTTTDLHPVREAPLFAAIDDVSLSSFTGAREEQYPRGAAIIRAGEPLRAVYLVREGGAKESQTTPEGKEVILALHGPGDLFGELGFFGAEEAPSSVTALVPTRLVRVPRESWLELAARHPDLERILQERLARRITEAWRLVRMLSRYTTEARLRSALLILSERWGRPREGGIEIGIELTHRTLADLTGASREKVTRALGALQRKGLVRSERRRLVVPSLDLLVAE